MNALSVFSPRRFGRLLAADAMNVGRDPMLLFAIALSVAPSVALTLGRSSLDEAASAAFGIMSFSRFVIPVALMVPAMLIGWVTGFLLLEDRDEGLLSALSVTPIGKVGYLTYRVAATAVIAAAITALATLLLLPDAPWFLHLLLALLIGCEAVLAAVVLPAVARNKVEGLAVTKLTNLAGAVPLLAILATPWRFLAGIVPSYWIGELLGLSKGPGLPMVVTAALAVATHAVAALLLFRLFSRRLAQ